MLEKLFCTRFEMTEEENLNNCELVDVENPTIDF
jgi:hypothetical protein